MTTSYEERQRIEQKLDELNALNADRDARIEALRDEVRSLVPQAAPSNAASLPAAPPPDPQTNIVVAPATLPAQQTAATPPEQQDGSGLLGIWGTYEPGKGFVLLRNRTGEVSLSLI